MDSVVKFSAVASCAFCLYTPGIRPADHQRVAYRRRSGDYCQRLWHHARELWRWWLSAVKSLIVMKSSKWDSIRISKGIIYMYKDMLYDWKVLLVKEHIYERITLLQNCCGGPLYGPVDRHKTCKLGKPVYIERSPFLKNRSFKTGDFKFLKLTSQIIISQAFCGTVPLK
jgi:hypothetical protein